MSKFMINFTKTSKKGPKRSLKVGNFLQLFSNDVLEKIWKQIQIARAE